MQGPKREDYFKAKHGDGSIPPAGTPAELKERAARISFRNKLSAQLQSRTYRELQRLGMKKKPVAGDNHSPFARRASFYASCSRIVLFELKHWDYIDLLSQSYLTLLNRLSN